MTRKTLIGLMAAMAIGAAQVPAQAQQLRFEWGDGDLRIDVWPLCVYDKPEADHGTVRANARASGYRRIRGISYHARKFNNVHRCGFYRANAVRDGRRYRLFFDADSGELIAVRHLGKYAGETKIISETQARRRLRRADWRKIRNLRYVDQGPKEYYIARATNAGVVHRVWLNADTGGVVRTKRIEPAQASRKDVRQALRARGYRQIKNLRFVDRGAREYWIARATKNGKAFRIFANAETDRPVRRIRIDKGVASKAEVRHTLRAAGFRGIRNVRFVNCGSSGVYVAEAKRWGAAYRIWLDGEDAEIRRFKRL